MQKKFLFILFLFLSLAAPAQATKDLLIKSTKAHRYKAYPAFLELSKQLDSIRPSHPVYTYNLACAYALNGKPQESIAALEKSIIMDSKTEFEKDSDLVSLQQLPDFQRLIQLKTDMDKKIETSKKEASLSEKDLHPEGLLYLSKSKIWLATSIRKGKIVSFDMRNGKCSDWLKADGMFPVFAMKADADEKYLWVATSVIPEFSGYTREIDDKAEILKVEVKTKKIVQRFSVLGNHVFGDLVVAKNGTVYVSDSYKPAIYKIENDSMSQWLELKGSTFNLQGIAFNGDESRIYIADYFSGILEIPINNIEKKHWLDFPKGTVQKGIDGMLWYKNSLIAIQNGVNPIRIIQFLLDDSGDKITGYKTIDNNRAEFNEPASGFIKGGKFYFFANCPWNAYDKKHQLDESKFENPMLFSFELN